MSVFAYAPSPTPSPFGSPVPTPRMAPLATPTFAHGQIHHQHRPRAASTSEFARPQSSHGSQATGSGKKQNRVLNCDHCRYKKMKCDRGQPCSNCLLREVECVYENPQPATAAQPVVRSQSFVIATLRRDAAQLIARLGLSQKEVERLALEADRQLAEEAEAGGAGVAQLARPRSACGGIQVGRVAGRPYPELAQRRPTTAPDRGGVGSSAPAVGGSPDFAHRTSPLAKLDAPIKNPVPSLAGPARNHGVTNRSRSGTAPSRYATTSVPPSAVGAAMRPPPSSTAPSGPSPRLIRTERPRSSSGSSKPKPISVLFTPPVEVDPSPNPTPLASAEPPTPTVPVTILTARPVSPATIAMPPPRAPTRKMRPARITLPLPATGTGAGATARELMICLTPGWLSLRPIRGAGGGPLKSPSVPTPSPSKWRFSGLPSISHFTPGWAGLRREAGVRMEVD